MPLKKSRNKRQIICLTSLFSTMPFSTAASVPGSTSCLLTSIARLTKTIFVNRAIEVNKQDVDPGTDAAVLKGIVENNDVRQMICLLFLDFFNGMYPFFVNNYLNVIEF